MYYIRATIKKIKTYKHTYYISTIYCWLLHANIALVFLANKLLLLPLWCGSEGEYNSLVYKVPWTSYVINEIDITVFRVEKLIQVSQVDVDYFWNYHQIYV